MQGSTLQVLEYHSFYSSYLPVCSNLSKFKLNGNIILCLASQEG